MTVILARRPPVTRVTACERLVNERRAAAGPARSYPGPRARPARCCRGGAAPPPGSASAPARCRESPGRRARLVRYSPVNIFSRSSGETPMPVSETASSAARPPVRSVTAIRPPSGLYFTALPSRLSTTWRSRLRSPGSTSSAGQLGVDGQRRRRRPRPGCTRTDSRTTSARSIGVSCTAACPVSSADSSSSSLMMCRSWVVLRSITSSSRGPSATSVCRRRPPAAARCTR